MEEENEVLKAWRDFLFEFGKTFGVLYIVKKLKFLKFKDWVQRRMID